MIIINVTELPGTKEYLKNYPLKFRKSLITGFTKAVKFLEGEVKKSFGQAGKPKVRTGALRRSITSTIQDRQRYLEGILGSNLIYAPVQEFGATIRPKNKQYLTFKIGNRWVKIKEAVIPARPYLYPTINLNVDRAGNIITNQIVGDMK